MSTLYSYNLRSGTEDVYFEKDHLLQEIEDLYKNLGPSSNKKKRKELSSEEISNKIGKDMRDRIAFEFYCTELEESHTINNGDENENVNAENNFTAELHEIDAGVNFTQNPINLIEDNRCINSNAHTTKCQESTFETHNETSRIPTKILGPNRKRKNRNNYLKKNALEYLNDKGEREHKLRSKELELEERKLLLAERKLNLEERRLNFDIEQKTEDRKLLNDVLESQLKIIQVLSNQLNCFGKFYSNSSDHQSSQ
jgi:hypothetical protein